MRLTVCRCVKAGLGTRHKDGDWGGRTLCGFVPHVGKRREEFARHLQRLVRSFAFKFNLPPSGVLTDHPLILQVLLLEFRISSIHTCKHVHAASQETVSNALVRTYCIIESRSGSSDRVGVDEDDVPQRKSATRSQQPVLSLGA